ncbi:translin-associated protein X [Capsaspora owczarzaki ATCC 30864]|nr:translin-associated protein X [Capsaspora owczarzaki ATCC 30864]|eukprot:XP_004340462.2 translin-associated protein X [Capsaspora owczarzaki ATCC 30864]
MTLFRQFAATMDAKNDRHERLVKLSRDLTVQSKRVIFAAQRATDAKQRDAIVAQALQTLEDIRQNQIRPMAVELVDQNPILYARAYSPGMQEYIEAVSFVHYLATATLITQRQLEEQLLFDEALSFPVTITDYLLGVTDLTGELMRFAIASVGSGNQQEPMLIGSFVRTLTQVFSLLTGTGIRDLPAKLRVMQSSLEKIEQVCYNITVRGSEIPKEMLAQAAQFWSSSSATTSGPGDDYAGGAGGNQNDD